MESLNHNSVSLFIQFIDKLNAEDRIKICVEPLSDLRILRVKTQVETKHGIADIYTIGQYFERCGDRIPDPAIKFICVDQRSPENRGLDLVWVYPESFTNCGFSLNCDTGISSNNKYSSAMYELLCSLADQWLMDIQAHGFLSADTAIVMKDEPTDKEKMLENFHLINERLYYTGSVSRDEIDITAFHPDTQPCVESISMGDMYPVVELHNANEVEMTLDEMIRWENISFEGSVLLLESIRKIQRRY